MDKLTIIQKPSPNFNWGRSGYTPEILVIHIMQGSLSGTDEWFANPLSRVSANYGIGFNGEIHQYVQDEDEAWAQGPVNSPTFKLYKPNVNPNWYCLSVENEGDDLKNAPETQLNALIALIYVLCTKYSIIPSRDTIIGHYQIDALNRPNCPATDKLILDTIVSRVVTLQANNNKNTMNQIKWIKSYTTGSDVVNTYNVANNAVESVGETHAFTGPDDAQAKSTSEVLILWDSHVVGAGALSA